MDHWDILLGLRSWVDLGLFVLIWLVQLVIYPSFYYIADEKLQEWHKIYTRRISYFVLPLMLAQLSLALMALGGAMSWYSLVDCSLVVACWGLTFWLSVPLHHAIAEGDRDPALRIRLIQTNLPRALVWSAIFILGFFKPVLLSGA